VTTPSIEQQILSEAKIHSSLNHPNIIQLKGIRKLSENTIGFVINLADGSLYDAIHGSWNIKMDDWKIKFSKEITSAMIYLNNRDPPNHHRDLKSENVLILHYRYDSIPPIIKIADFGLANIDTNAQQNAYMSNIGYDGIEEFTYSPEWKSNFSQKSTYITTT